MTNDPERMRGVTRKRLTRLPSWDVVELNTKWAESSKERVNKLGRVFDYASLVCQRFHRNKGENT